MQKDTLLHLLEPFPADADIIIETTFNTYNSIGVTTELVDGQIVLVAEQDDELPDEF